MEQAQGTSSTGNTSEPVSQAETTKTPRKQRGYMVTFWTHDYPHALPRNAKYLCTCEDSTKAGLWHGHAFIYFKNPLVMKAVKKLFGDDCHCEKPFKNSDCIKYVLDTTKRKHDFQEFGNRPMDNGMHAMEDVLECNTVTEVMEKMPDTYVKYRRGIIDIMQNKQSKQKYFKPPFVKWIYGPSGCGKSREAFEAGCAPVIYNDGFFSDWGDARKILIDDFRGEIPYNTLLRLLDGYHNFNVANIKGGQKLIDLDAIYITSPYHPSQCYPKQNQKIDSIEQLMRRITCLASKWPDNFDISAAKK